MNTPQMWLDFFEHVRDVRKLQKLYRKTMDPGTRRECENQELLLDATIANIGAQSFAAAEPEACSAAAAVEGGVS